MPEGVGGQSRIAGEGGRSREGEAATAEEEPTARRQVLLCGPVEDCRRVRRREGGSIDGVVRKGEKACNPLSNGEQRAQASRTEFRQMSQQGAAKAASR